MPFQDDKNVYLKYVGNAFGHQVESSKKDLRRGERKVYTELCPGGV